MQNAATNAQVTVNVLDQLPMVRSIAKRIARRYPSGFDVDDLTQIGMMSLMACAERAEGGVLDGAALSYARIRVQGAMVDALRKSDFVPRSVRTRARRLTETRERLSRELGRAPTTGELASDWSTTPGKFEQMQRRTVVLSLVPLNDSRTDDDRCNEPVRADDTPYEQTARRDRTRTIAKAIAALPEREQAIVNLYYFEERSLKEIGAILGVTESRVCQLLTRAKARLAEALAEAA